MKAAAPRKGASRAADIAPDILAALSQGAIPSVTLTECLALDQKTLLRTVFPDLSSAAMLACDAACQSGILKRMAGIGGVLLHALGEAGIDRCRAHAADTVRGWACFMIGAQTDLTLAARLAAIAPLADDSHFGVREWAWMAVRPQLAADLDTSIGLLAAWTTSPSERLRRFACEALRPRGVWCSHIAALKKAPEQALPILSALRNDASVYVQDSLGNWLNDAGKDQPAWVQHLCAQWLQGEPAPATVRICQRALRNLA